MKSSLLAALAVTLIPAIACADVVLVVKTSGNVAFGAGTDSNIYVRLTDSDSTSRRLRLQDLTESGNILESGMADVFQIKDPALNSAILSIQVESDGTWADPDWHLEEMIAITFDPNNIDSVLNYPTVLVEVMGGIYDPKAPKKGVLVSSFLYEDWVKFDSNHMANNELQPGVLLIREEPIAEAVGPAEAIKTTLYVVYSADALDSDQPVERAWETTISRSESLTVTDEQSDQATVGLELTAGYSAGDGPGVYGSATLSAEYQFVKAKTTEKVWGTEVSNSTNDTFEAEPGTIQFRILSTPGVLSQQNYVSLIQDKTFKGRYVQEASPFVPTGVTFTKDTLDDDKWNRSVARALAVTQGKAGYDQTVSRLKLFGILSAPMTYEQAIGG